MLTVKFVTYHKEQGKPSAVKFMRFASAQSLYLDYENDGRAILRFNDESVSVGEIGDTSYDVAYVMNEAGKTVDTVK